VCVIRGAVVAVVAVVVVDVVAVHLPQEINSSERQECLWSCINKLLQCWSCYYSSLSMLYEGRPSSSSSVVGVGRRRRDIAVCDCSCSNTLTNV